METLEKYITTTSIQYRDSENYSFDLDVEESNKIIKSWVESIMQNQFWKNIEVKYEKPKHIGYEIQNNVVGRLKVLKETDGLFKMVSEHPEKFKIFSKIFPKDKDRIIKANLSTPDKTFNATINYLYAGYSSYAKFYSYGGDVQLNLQISHPFSKGKLIKKEATKLMEKLQNCGIELRKNK